MDVIEAIHGRRSIRSYANISVDDALIESIIWDAAQAPPPFRNNVPWTFNVIKGRGKIAELEEKAMAYVRDFHRSQGNELVWLARPDFKIFWDAPVVIVISGNVQDCCRAGQNLMLSAYSRGLGTCWVGSPLPWLQTEEAKSELRLPGDLDPTAVFCMGYPDQDLEAPTKQRPQICWIA